MAQHLFVCTVDSNAELLIFVIALSPFHLSGLRAAHCNHFRPGNPVYQGVDMALTLWKRLIRSHRNLKGRLSNTYHTAKAGDSDLETMSFRHNFTHSINLHEKVLLSLETLTGLI